MKNVFIMIGLVALVSACTDENASRNALYKAGYSDVVITGYSWFECGEHDTFHTGFRAKNPAGNVVDGTVCCGFMTKGCTIRF